MSSLSLSLLGHLSVAWGERPFTTFRSNRVPALLAYLAVEADRPHRREALMALLWPGMPTVSARQNLRQTLYLLRKDIPKLAAKTGTGTVPLLLSNRHTVQLNSDGDLFLDVAQMEQLVNGGTTAVQLTEAIALYRGDFLADFYLPDSENFEEWAAARRAAYRRLVLAAMTRLTAVHLEQNDLTEAETYARRQLEMDNLRESGHRQLMAVLAGNGRRRAVLSHYENLSHLLQAELNIKPSPETEALAQAVRAGELRGKAVAGREERGAQSALSTPHSSPSPPLPPHNSPPQATPFIGRAQELTTLAGFLTDPSIRLVTIVGAGGMGKTRLALAAAEQQITADALFPHGIFFVDLAPLNDSEQMVSTIADALNFPLQAGDGRSPQQQLLDFLARKKMLLLLDNFEHLLAGVAFVTDILQAAPDVQILVTSRERLHLRAEQLYTIEGLAFADGERDDVIQSSAVQLFLQSARRNQPDFALHSEEDFRHLAHICHTVAGMPLALELAASWVDILPLGELVDELQQGLGFLETDMHDIPERHRSVRAAMNHSWQKLDEKEQAVFAKLSVFRGGFTREAAQAVAGANLCQLARLVNKSLVRGGGKNGRYTLHELLRQYSAEKLAEDSEIETAVRQQHSHFYCIALQNWEADLKGPRQRTAMAEMEADYQNIVAAWNEALLRGHLAQLVNVVNGLGTFYNLTNRWVDGIATMQKSAEKIQDSSGDTPTTVTAAQLLVWVWAWQGSLEASKPGFYPFQPAIALNSLQSSWTLISQPVLVGSDTRAEKAFIQLLFGIILLYSEREKGKEHLAASLYLYRSLGDDWGVAEALSAHAPYAYFAEMPEQTYKISQESLALFRQIGEPRRVIQALKELGSWARHVLAFEEAYNLFEEAYVAAQVAGYHQEMMHIRRTAAWLAWYLGQFDQALTYQQEALALSKQINSLLDKASILTDIALTHVYLGNPSWAIDLFQESMEVAPMYDADWSMMFLPFAHLHAGRYGTAESLINVEIKDFHHQILAWVKLTQAKYTEALSLAKQRFEGLGKGRIEERTWIQVPLAFALCRLEQVNEAKQELYQCLQTCLQIRAFLPLMQLMPLIPVVLADGADDRGKERAVELYAMAESLPFVGNSQLFADLTGKTMTAVAKTLPPAVVVSAQARGQELDWWQTAESLLTELKELGWSGPVD